MLQKHSKKLLLFSLLYTVVIMMWMWDLRKTLVIPERNINALFSLEMSWGQSRVEEVVTVWREQNLIPVANKMNIVDFLFILGYVSFLYFSIIFLSKSRTFLFKKFIQTLQIICLIITLFDTTEGIANIFWLQNQIDKVSPIVVSILATIKFILVIPVLVIVLMGLLRTLFIKSNSFL